MTGPRSARLVEEQSCSTSDRTTVRSRVLLRSYRAGFAQTATQPSQLFGFAFFFILPPIILASVWKAAAGSSGGDIVGYDASALVWYIVISETAILTIRNRLIEEIGDDIASGRFAIELQRPISALPIRLATELGYMTPRLALGFVLAMIIGLGLGGAPPAIAGLLLAVPSLVVALAINVVGQHFFAAASFWLREAKGAWFLYNKLVFVLGGMLLPLEVLPGWLETVAKSLPFMAMAYIPARLSAGFVEPELFLIQGFWLLVGLGAATWAFRRGEHRFMDGGDRDVASVTNDLGRRLERSVGKPAWFLDPGRPDVRQQPGSFLIFWVVFFREVQSLRGWDVDRILVLLSILTTVAGIVLGLLHNVRRIGHLAADGGLDAALSLPVPTLSHLALRRVEPVNVGDLFFGLALFVLFGSPTPARIALFIFGVLCGASVLLGFFILVGSLGFFAGKSDSADLGLQSILLFSHYPIDIFPGLVRLFLYAVVPAGFVSATPARLIDDFDLGWAALAILASVAFLGFGRWVFGRGLRRYTSGSVWATN